MRSSHLIVLAPLLILFAYPSVAQVPSGQFTYAFTNTSLWDVSGSYTNDSDPNGYDVVIGTIEHFANGALSGNRLETYDDGIDNYWQGTGSITGKTVSKPIGVTLRSKWVGTYNGTANGVSFLATVRGKDTGVIVPSTLSVAGVSGSARVCVLGGRCVTAATSGPPLPLPDGMNGDWTLDINIAADANKLTGTGTLTLSNGRILSYLITGSYKSTSQVAKLKLVGEGDATGTRLSLTTLGVGMDLTSLKGKVLGQKLKFP